MAVPWSHGFDWKLAFSRKVRLCGALRHAGWVARSAVLQTIPAINYYFIAGTAFLAENEVSVKHRESILSADTLSYELIRLETTRRF